VRSRKVCFMVATQPVKVSVRAAKVAKSEALWSDPGPARAMRRAPDERAPAMKPA